MQVKRPHAKVATRVNFLNSDISSLIRLGMGKRSVITSMAMVMEPVRIREEPVSTMAALNGSVPIKWQRLTNEESGESSP